ncbi:Fasciclin-like arabinogalactan protein 12 [Morella rubra]|uniref:Fasciclin-like arabinogalactan protein 12 n=1 Tax=Morella rubra TaxID=262757 RepID=A0A6A1WM99_9ROSI|nr:Fasciclin-like arabinogalactan protein 12 [Morella rubra]
MTKQALFSVSLLLVLHCHCIAILGQPAQAPALPADAPVQAANAPAQSPVAPAGPGPTDVIKILKKVGGFTILIRLLKSTGTASQLRGQLKNSNIGFTLFAPNDVAFSNLKAGTLNSLSDEQKVRLIQFHVLPSFYSVSNLQTASNPVRTQAGDTNPGDYPLNLTTTGSQVNMSTGLVNASVIGTMYSDNQLAVYQVDKVLLPLDIFVAKPPVPAPAPAPTKPKAKKKTAGTPKPSTSTSTTSTVPTVVASAAPSPPQAPAQPANAPVQPANPPVQPANPPVQPASPPVQSANAPVQSATVPVQKGPLDVTKILAKAGGYLVFIRLLKSTGVAKQLFGQLNNSDIGFTIFAPTDAAFSNLKPGTINSLSDLQKTELVQFHILNTVVTLSNFQTLSNPVPTEAGDTTAGEFPLNVTTAGNQVNISTGLVNTTMGGTVYSDSQLAIYEVDKVLLPMDIFVPKAKVAAPTPTPSKPKKNAADDDQSLPGGAAAKVDASGGVSLSRHGGMTLVPFGVALAAFLFTKGT